MSDLVSGIKNITPAYPLKPVQPAQKDREAGNRKKPPRDRKEKHDKDDDKKTTIDEHV